MSNITKQDILDAIRRTTKENGGTPLGEGRFVAETGIKPYDWKKFWARFGDAHKEAGFASNRLTSAYDNEFIIKKMIGLIRKLNKFPVHGELRIEKSNDPEFPSSGSLFDTKKRKQELAAKIIEWCKGKNEYDGVVKSCLPILEEFGERGNSNDNTSKVLGEVYLFKSGRYYKIGKTCDTVRRGGEIKIQLPERTDLIHSIKTDDPSGIEAYWHKRFEAKRMQGEWFNLSSTDVKTFKRWRRIY